MTGLYKELYYDDYTILIHRNFDEISLHDEYYAEIYHGERFLGFVVDREDSVDHYRVLGMLVELFILTDSTEAI